MFYKKVQGWRNWIVAFLVGSLLSTLFVDWVRLAFDDLVCMAALIWRLDFRRVPMLRTIYPFTNAILG